MADWSGEPIGTGWDVTRSVMLARDFDGDGNADLLAADNMTGTPRRAVAAGGFTAPGKPGLLAINTDCTHIRGSTSRLVDWIAIGLLLLSRLIVLPAVGWLAAPVCYRALPHGGGATR